jgi:hypothetical protein
VGVVIRQVGSLTVPVLVQVQVRGYLNSNGT